MLFELKRTIELPKPKLCNGCDFLKSEAKKNNCALGCTSSRKDDTDKFFRGEDCVLTLVQAEEKAPEVPAAFVGHDGVILASFLRERMLSNIEMATNAILKDVQTAILEAEQKYMFVTTVSVGILPRPAWDFAIIKLTDAGYEAEYIVDQQGGDFVQVSWLPPVATPCEKQDIQESSELG
jgi:hypothetical protein